MTGRVVAIKNDWIWEGKQTRLLFSMKTHNFRNGWFGKNFLFLCSIPLILQNYIFNNYLCWNEQIVKIHFYTFEMSLRM